MYNCIRMEFRKCFHSHNFIISMATCVLLALSSASYCCQGYLNIHDALDQYCFENGHMVSNELFPVWTSYNYWIGGESETLAYSAFYTLNFQIGIFIEPSAWEEQSVYLQVGYDNVSGVGFSYFS